ncbi:hypothetical protein [Poseidonibacter ostreae]|uniref:Oligosaccharide repeat unit polymerase n=1 Tax=Poseidonibacter ostreae TaxID=2654171 RepID=A0A6L4WX09_9BACT|nr:hypothetical protein [Poseidonibacter ostreae]KAB7889879.1 hypothetical protein GBG19_04840 [Poseidonibacter ostreae]KAB7890200.1 hypothetical protein GBG18_09415 [Poseidonibacter ostreae]
MNTLKIEKIFIVEFLFIICIKLIIEYFYLEILSTTYLYAGFVLDFDMTKYIIGWIIYLFGYSFLYYKRKLHIFEIYLFLYFLYFLPNVVYFSLSNQPVLDFVSLVFPFLFLIFMTTNKEIIPLSRMKYGKLVVLSLSLGIITLVIWHFYKSTGGAYVLNFLDVYPFRAKYDDVSNAGIYGYLNSWAMKIFSVFLLAWALLRAKISLIIIAGISIIMLFIFSGHKSALQGIVLVSFFYFLFGFKDRRVLIIGGFFFMFLIASVLTIFADQIMIGSVLIRRLLFVPAQLNFSYIEYFSLNEHIYWANSVLKLFMDYPYEVTPAKLIGTFLGEPDMSANTGFIASGFMHGSYLGILIYMLIAVIIFNIINLLAKNIDKYIVLSIIILPINTMFISSDLLTTLLTHGLIIAIIVLWLYDSEEYRLSIKKLSIKI